MSRIVQIALQEVGVTEVPENSNSTKYGIWFGWDGVAWCAQFVSWCYANAGFPLGNIGFKKGFAGCQTGYNHFKKQGELTDHPQPGDIVLFDWNGDGRYDHTGIFVQDLGSGEFETIEGNTAVGNDSNGGKVMVRRRKYRFATFVHPKVLDKQPINSI
jgi:hypothetical protein